MIFISVEELTNIINFIPYILQYIIYGYIYLTTYYWISFKDNKNFDNIIIKSIVSSFILKYLYTTLFNIDLSMPMNIVLFIVISGILGLIIGKITTHKYFNALLHKLHLGRTTNHNIWDDVTQPYCWIRIFMKDNTSYLGQYRYGEAFTNEPIVVLANWQKLDIDSNVIIDNSGNLNELIMLNTKDFEKIEITYQSNKG